jgi:uncharacterized protein YjbJ (UPF0337 family)
MRSDILQIAWNMVKDDVKEFFGKLTDDDLSQINGNADEMYMKLQERYGYTKEQAQDEWNNFIWN